MLFIEDYSDERQKAWCIHCGKAIADLEVNSDHVPTKALLSRRLRRKGAEYDCGLGAAEGYLPQVVVCKPCNSKYSSDESYLLCVLHAVHAGSLYPDPETHPEAARVLRSNRNVIRDLKGRTGRQCLLFGDGEQFTLYPDAERVGRVVVKNARGHAYHEIGEPLLEPPARMWFAPLSSMRNDQRTAFEGIGAGLDFLPEVGSRMTVRVADGTGMAGGWVEVEEARYRYAVDWSSGVTVRTVIWEYLATESQWAP